MNADTSHGNASRRQRLLEAAAALVIQKGTARLTLDAVSEAAHVSKGGLLYYFDSKAALLEALVDDLTEQLRTQVSRETETGDALAQARTYLRAIAQMGELPPGQQHAKALTAICATDPELIQRVQERLNIRRRDGVAHQATGGADELEALHLRLVADGLWLADLFGCYAIDADQRGKLLERLGVGP